MSAAGQKNEGVISVDSNALVKSVGRNSFVDSQAGEKMRVGASDFCAMEARCLDADHPPTCQEYVA